MKEKQEQQGSTEYSLVTRPNGGTDMTSPQSRGLLKAVDFSPQLPARLMRLNDVFTGLAPIVNEVSIRLIPGKVPKIDAYPSYEAGYGIGLDGRRSGRAELRITSLDGILPQWAVSIGQIQAFLADVAPDKKATIEVTPRSEVCQTINPISTAVESVTQDFLHKVVEEHQVETSEGVKTMPLYDRSNVSIRLEGQDSPLFVAHLWDFWKSISTSEKQVGFLVDQMTFEGKTVRVEEVLEKVVDHFFPTRLTQHSGK